MTVIGRLRRNTYVDSVALMHATAQVQALPGVTAAALVMATDLNRGLLAGAGLLAPDTADAGANDLVLVVRADTSAAAHAALNRAEELLAARRSGEDVPPATDEFLMAMLRHAVANDFPIEHAEGGKQRGRAVARVVMRHRPTAALLQRKTGLGADEMGLRLCCFQMR